MTDFYGGNNLLFHNTEAIGFNINSLNLFNIYGGSKDDAEEKKDTNFIIPVGLIKFNPPPQSSKYNIKKEASILHDDIYDKLLELVNVNHKPIKNNSKKNKTPVNNKTKKNK
jgi:hypothetical protein